MQFARILAGCLALWIPAAPAASAETLSRESVIAAALQRNPQVQAGQSQQHIANAKRDAARAGWLPRLDLSTQARRSDNPLDAFADKLNTRSVDPATDFTGNALNQPDTSTLYATRLSLQWPLFTSGETLARNRAASHGTEAADRAFGHTRQRIAHAAATAYLHGQAAVRAVSILDDAVSAAQRHVNTTGRLVREGRIIQADLLTAEVFLANVQNEHEKAQQRLSQTRHALARIMGRDALTGMALVPWSNERSPAPDDEAGKAYARAIQQRQDLLALKSQHESLRAQRDAARAQHGPRFSVIANRDWYDDEPGLAEDSWSVAGVLSLNLYAGGQIDAEVRGTAARADELAAHIREQELLVHSELADARARLASAHERLRITGTHVDKARRGVSQITKRYGQGRTILIDVLQAERALLETRHQALLAALDYETAVLDWALATGTAIDGTISNPEQQR